MRAKAVWCAIVVLLGLATLLVQAQPALEVESVELREGDGCELLVYDSGHWMDRLDPADLAMRRLDKDFDRKYESRNRRGDIVVVYRAGRCTEKPTPSSRFVIVACPDLSYEDAKASLESAMLDDKGEMVAKRRHKLDMGLFWTYDGQTTFPLVVLRAVMVDKATISVEPR